MAETLPSAFDTWFAARHPEIPVAAVRAALELAQGGAPAAFIGRYRRDRTGGLDTRSVRQALEAAELAAKVRSRQSIILESIERHATLQPELRERILATFDPDELEDLYHPYRQQKKNRALVAREAGLQGLADWIWDCGHGSDRPQEGQTLELWAFTFRSEEKGVPDAKSAIEGARDILVERLAGSPELRALVRREYFEKGQLHATRAPKAKPHSRFESYFAFHERVKALREPQHALGYLALRRGLAEDELQLSIGGGAEDAEFEARLVAAFEAAACTVPDSPGAEVLRHAARIALKNDVRTAIENEVHRVLKDAADAVVVAGFAESARRRLLAAPLGARPVVGVDPGPRGGCRLAALDAAGSLLASRVVELANDEQKAAAGEILSGFVREHGAAAVAVGDGSGGRDAELVTRAALRAAALEVPVVLVGEAGANAWAGSEAARTELSEVEPPVRAAVSIGRRLQDPLAELVKLDPKTLGAGQHHHDVPHALLHRALDAVVEDAISSVGVDLNTAPRALLSRVPGLGPALAAAIVEQREAVRFATRRALLDVPQVTAGVFEQAAGFLRVKGGEHPLDDSAVHPECYAALEALAARHGKAVGELLGPGAALVREARELDQELGPLAHADVARALEQAGQDPRERFVPFAFRDDVRALDQLKPGMLCPGLVTNVTSFGVFVDVGAQHDGLVHVSQLGSARGKGAGRALQPGDRVEVRVLKVDLEKKQVSLTMRPPPERKPAPPRKPAARPAPRRPAPAPASGEAKADAAPGERRPAPPERRPRPSRPRPASAERPPRRDAGAPAAGRSSPGPGRPSKEKPAAERRPSEPRRQAFNNPFAVLADLKKTGKS